VCQAGLKDMLADAGKAAMGAAAALALAAVSPCGITLNTQQSGQQCKHTSDMSLYGPCCLKCAWVSSVDDEQEGQEVWFGM
jgi:hypothetical protein